jgi:hypothetical protein
MEGTVPRKIIHVDMDAFPVAGAQRDFPKYAGAPSLWAAYQIRAVS